MTPNERANAHLAIALNEIMSSPFGGRSPSPENILSKDALEKMICDFEDAIMRTLGCAIAFHATTDGVAGHRYWEGRAYGIMSAREEELALQACKAITKTLAEIRRELGIDTAP